MKKNKYIFIILFFIIMIPFNVDALCTTKKYNNLKKVAFKVELSYELKFDENNNHYFEVYASNIDKSVYLVFNGNTYRHVDGEDVIALGTRLEGGVTYDFNIYGEYDTSCPAEFLYKKRLSIPKYNKYSERDECIEYEEFSLCNRWYQGKIPDDEYFRTKLEEYVESLKKKNKEEVIEDKDKNIFETIIDFYVDNIKITLPATIIIVLLIVVYVVRRIIRRRNRIKLDD